MSAPSPITATVEQFKAISGLGKTTIFELIKAGSIRSVRLMGRRLIIVDSYRELLDQLAASDRGGSP
jgi:hypothetical protein